MRISLAVLASALSLQVAQGYGILGHTLTGQIAQLLLTPETSRQVKEILSPYYDGLLSKAAPWPDTIKMRPQYRWASVMHYVNTPGDNPPNMCKFEYSAIRHDVVNGIFNMTATLIHYKAHPPPARPPSHPASSSFWPGSPRAMNHHHMDNINNNNYHNNNKEEDDDEENNDPGRVDRAIREDALRFLVHFMGDIHQPLHTAGKARGGNDAPARWGRAKTSLHKIWDGQLIMKDIKENFNNDPKAFLDNIMEMTTTFWAPASANWSICNPDVIVNELLDNPWAASLQPQQPQHQKQEQHLPPSSSFPHNRTILQHLCPKSWAREMNKLACEYAWNGYDLNSTQPAQEQDLSQGEYYHRATNRDHGYLIRRLLAQSGVRMAAVLNGIYDPNRPAEGHLAAWRPWRSSSSDSSDSSSSWAMDGRLRYLRRPQSGYWQTVEWLRDWIEKVDDEGQDDHAGCSDDLVVQNRASQHAFGL
ncbi:hypothetical protein BGZ73_009048 [Actinomortierella ambigua]|nr:hypothetical protein BGZ73_009048 [Actinomortierella ambigua]